MMLNQVGEVASSKSAIHTRAPELSAPIVIFRVGGPVISQRRSARPGASGATRQVGSSRIAAVSGRKRNGCFWSLRLRLTANSSARRPANWPWSRQTKSSPSSVRISSERSCIAPTTLSSLVSGLRGRCDA